MDPTNYEPAIPPARGDWFLRCMLYPRATYHPDEHKVGLGWWALFIVGMLVFGLRGLLALVIEGSDKKFLKQMALAIFYKNTPFVVGVLVLAAITVQDVSDMVGFGIIAVLFGWVAMSFGFGIAAYAQHKIDRMVTPRD